MNVGSVTSVKNMAEEALETAAQTKAEAAKGDQQAARRIAQTQAASNSQTPAQPAATPPGRLNVKA